MQVPFLKYTNLFLFSDQDCLQTRTLMIQRLRRHKTLLPQTYWVRSVELVWICLKKKQNKIMKVNSQKLRHPFFNSNSKILIQKW